MGGAAYNNIVPRENPVEYGWIMSSNNMYKPVLTLDAIIRFENKQMQVLKPVIR